MNTDTIFFDRPLYAGGASFANLVTPLFPPGSVAQNVNKDVILTEQPEAVKRDYRFLWGVGLSVQATDWPGTQRWITVLRDPIARFLSLLYYFRTVAPKESFWECALLAECSSLDQFVDAYLQRRDIFLRSQFSDILSYMDYSGLEWFHDPQVYTENEVFAALSTNQVIEAVRARYASVYLIEYQEESAFRFAMDHGLNASRLSLSRPTIIHHAKTVPQWTEAETSAATMDKVRHLLRDEIAVYEHFKADFLAASLDDVFQNSAYHALKAYSIRLNPKIHKDFEARAGRYTPSLFYAQTAAPHGLRLQMNNKRLHYFQLSICHTTAFLQTVTGRFVLIGLTPWAQRLVLEEMSQNQRDRLLGFVRATPEDDVTSFCGKPVYTVSDLPPLLSLEDLIIGRYDACWMDVLRQIANEEYLLNDVYLAY